MIKGQADDGLTFEKLLDFLHLLGVRGQQDSVYWREIGGNPKDRLELVGVRVEEIGELTLHLLLELLGEGVNCLALVFYQWSKTGQCLLLNKYFS